LTLSAVWPIMVLPTELVKQLAGNTRKEVHKLALSPSQINELLSDARDRGGYERYIRTFVESGDMGLNVMEKFSTKERDSVYNSLNSNIKKIAKEEENGDWPELRLVKKTVEETDEETGEEKKVEHLFLINETLFNAAQAEAASDSTEDSEV
jgi:hypothetical protein